jgi:hypothetical protein
MPVCVAFAQIVMTGAMKNVKAIPSRDMRSCLSSSHYVLTSAYKDFEAPSADHPNGIFASSLSKQRALMIKASSDPAIMEKLLNGLRGHLKGKAGEAVTADLINEMVANEYCRDKITDRMTAAIKIKEVKKSEAELAGDALLELV